MLPLRASVGSSRRIDRHVEPNRLLLISTKRPFSTGESWPSISWFGQWSADPPVLCHRGRRVEKSGQSPPQLNRSAVGRTANSLVCPRPQQPRHPADPPGLTPPLSQSDPPRSSSA